MSYVGYIDYCIRCPRCGSCLCAMTDGTTICRNCGWVGYIRYGVVKEVSYTSGDVNVVWSQEGI